MEGPRNWIGRSFEAGAVAAVIAVGVHLGSGSEKPAQPGTAFVGDAMIPVDADRKKTYGDEKIPRRTDPTYDACADAGCDPMPPKPKYESATPEKPTGNPPSFILRNPWNPSDSFDNQWNA